MVEPAEGEGKGKVVEATKNNHFVVTTKQQIGVKFLHTPDNKRNLVKWRWGEKWFKED